MVDVEIEREIDLLLRMRPRPDAIVGLTDKITVGVLREVKNRNIRVPDDMPLLGYSNSDLTDLLSPSLTIVRQPAFKMGEIATDLLLQLIESKRPTKDFQRQVLQTELFVGESSMRKKVKEKAAL